VRYAPTDGGPIRDLSWDVVLTGWAVSYNRYPVSATPALEALEEQARTAGRGQWAPAAAGGCAQ
jgi:endonuclease YncB( thermonuclease family)